jgi:hypothetical protein
MNKRRFVFLLVVLVSIPAASVFVTFRTEITWVDPLSGTIKQESVRWFGLSRTTVLKTTALEAWQRRRRPDYSPTWQFVHSTGYDVWGRPLLFACGDAPPLYLFHSVLDRFVEQATDDDLSHFNDLLNQGDVRQIEAALEKAVEQSFSNPSAPEMR